MNNLKSSEVRQMFLDFFKEKKHQIEPSASLVPHEDPTLLWINSGVATLKKYFDGRIIPENPRITNAQKSIRTNDIENVGYTARHHTFFEMLGNFSIGDYFKTEAIEWAWEFLTSDKWIGFAAEKLSVTVHPEDEEAYKIWRDVIQLPEERIIRIEENFWDIGEGPSGPNTEIFYDRGESYGNNANDPELYPGGENERYLEIWNLVFSQFNHNPDDSYTPLPKKNIDTGMGLERLVSVIQDTATNFETDLFLPIIKKTEQIAEKKYMDDETAGVSYKVIADHIRTVTFAISDGALPSNEGRGYVLRRLLRRAVRYAKQIGIEKPFMYKLVPTVGNIMKDFYPEVKDKEAFIQNVIQVEEERFHETLHEGLSILETIIKQEKEQNRNVFPGEEVFRLYDTYGFPKELTEEYVQEAGFKIDEQGFELEMKKQRERARSARSKVGSMQVQEGVLAEITTPSTFIGYDQYQVESFVTEIIQDKQIISQIESGKEAHVMLDETPFYAESGGQIADIGIISFEKGQGKVLDVQKAPNGQHLHRIKVEEGILEKGNKIKAVVDQEKRKYIIKNHTATHLLHQALKDVLGTHVNQAGSLVSAERLRFDFSHFGAISEEEINQIESLVNQKIWQSIPVVIENKNIEEAKEMGAMALFGEKYGEVVRVVQVGDYSIELCGGCHVSNTAEIGLIKITTESGIGAGTRRIEAVTSKGAFEFFSQKEEQLEVIASTLKVKENNILDRIKSLNGDLKDLQKQNDSLQAKLSKQEATAILDEIKVVNDISILAKKVDVADMNQLRNMVDELKQKMDSGMILLAAVNNGKVQLAAGVTKDLIDNGYHAGNLIKETASICGGGGGGRPDMAQAGGKDPSKLDEAFKYVETYAKKSD
ncbi:alanine--tRNA ligase [Saliterribacillus persicus]|uniref:Alanine--tRNA ligase n=1 Tax=Saliterribacillus persicus TaxID=930114 RepID=A0A368XDG5_9BACI|nr:alanine--tRNA ligase [Saliterribacillus persicus]RCW65276.1 alanyl-tRNA synthetase [Saliterribacillus persicus]